MTTIETTTPKAAQAQPDFRELCSYCAGAIGSNISFALVSSYLFVFYTEAVGLAAVTAGTLLLVVRGVDAIADTIVGVAADNTKSKYGKFRPWLLYGGPLVFAACALCFISPPFWGTGKLVFAFCTCLFWSIAYTLCDIPYWSLTPVMAVEPAARTRVVAASRTCAQAGYWIALVGAFPLMRWLDGREVFGQRASGWLLVGAAVGLLCMIGFWVTFLGVRERVVEPRRRRQSPARVAGLLVKCAPLRQLLGTFFLLETIMAVRSAVAVYYFKYYCGREDLVPVYMAAYFTPVIAGCMPAPVVCRKLGKANAVRHPVLVSGALTAALWFARDHAAAVMLVVVFIGLLEGVSNIARMACLVDCVDYARLVTGERDEGSIFALNIIKTKLAGATGGALTGWLLGAIGYRANMAQGAQTLHWLALIFTVVIGVALMFSVFPMRRYGISHKY
jgi:GPH family glycoside/pentoside/hexuronide:cation symporter/probable glucitol transport protein GutA